jgi:hypothetical protein
MHPIFIYFHETTQSTDRASEHEHHWDSAALESLIVRSSAANAIVYGRERHIVAC